MFASITTISKAVRVCAFVTMIVIVWGSLFIILCLPLDNNCLSQRTTSIGSNFTIIVDILEYCCLRVCVGEK